MPQNKGRALAPAGCCSGILPENAPFSAASLATGPSFVRPKLIMSPKKPRNTPSVAEALCKFASIQGSKDPCSLQEERITCRRHKCEQALGKSFRSVNRFADLFRKDQKESHAGN